jgi:hypothetical protein
LCLLATCEWFSLRLAQLAGLAGTRASTQLFHALAQRRGSNWRTAWIQSNYTCGSMSFTPGIPRSISQPLDQTGTSALTESCTATFPSRLVHVTLPSPFSLQATFCGHTLIDQIRIHNRPAHFCGSVPQSTRTPNWGDRSYNVRNLEQIQLNDEHGRSNNKSLGKPHGGLSNTADL